MAKSGLNDKGRSNGWEFCKVKSKRAKRFFKKLIVSEYSISWPWRDTRTFTTTVCDCERQASGVQQRVVAVVESEKGGKKEKMVEVK